MGRPHGVHRGGGPMGSGPKPRGSHGNLPPRDGCSRLGSEQKSVPRLQLFSRKPMPGNRDPHNRLPREKQSRQRHRSSNSTTEIPMACRRCPSAQSPIALRAALRQASRLRASARPSHRGGVLSDTLEPKLLRSQSHPRTSPHLPGPCTPRELHGCLRLAMRAGAGHPCCSGAVAPPRRACDAPASRPARVASASPGVTATAVRLSHAAAAVKTQCLCQA